MLRPEEYDSTPITCERADTLRGLAEALGIDADGLERTVSEFNAAIADRPFDPTVKDGRAAAVDPPKSNWAMAIEEPPFYAYAVACGITFTFGGVHVDADARVLDESGRPLPGLFAAGELVGGLFSGNYPGGSGLTAGAVYGRRAGTAAARSST
jgi:tricarballylate dehydrogenase